MTTRGPKLRDEPADDGPGEDAPEDDDAPERPDARLTFPKARRIGRGDRTGNSGP